MEKVYGLIGQTVSHSFSKAYFDEKFFREGLRDYHYELFPLKNLELSFISKYVDDQYLDNTENKSRKLDKFFTEDFRIIYTLRPKFIKEISLIAQANNVFDTKYEPNGYTYSYIYGGALTTENYYFPMAGRNFLVSVNIKL